MLYFDFSHFFNFFSLMLKFESRLRKLIATDKTEQAIDELIRLFENYEKVNGQFNANEKDLYNKVIIQSSRFHAVANKTVNTGINEDSDKISKITISESLIRLLDEIIENKQIFNFIENTEEENEWGVAKKENTIEAYEKYFENYPNGKYKYETQKFIQELKDIELESLRTLKYKAEEEKRRRDNIETFQKDYNTHKVINNPYGIIFAEPGERLGALILDSIIYFFLSLIIAYLFFEKDIESFDDFLVVYAIISILLETLFVNTTGQTPAKYMMKFKVVKTTEYRELTFGESLLRAFIKNLFYSIPTLLVYLLSENKRFWHDKVADSIVIKSNKNTLSN